MHIINSLESYISFLNVFSEIDFFRGQASEDYALIPSIGRFYKPGYKNELLYFEKEIFEDFKRKYTMFTDVRPKNDMEFLFLAQHYGLPTRLLDWTYNPLIALYFACNTEHDKAGVVYQCMPFSRAIFNEYKDDILTFQHPTILTPRITDVRYKNQSGLFTLYSRPWEDQISTWITNKFIIPAPAKPIIINKLEKIGLTRAFIMPSLDSLCQEIVNLHYKRHQMVVK